MTGSGGGGRPGEDVVPTVAGVRMPAATSDPSAGRALVVLATSMVLVLSTWFSASVVLPQLRLDHGLSSAATSAVVVAVQVGFGLGALCAAFLSLPDRVPPRSLASMGAVGAASANLLPLWDLGVPGLVAGRSLVGASLALVYPSLIKAVAGWYRTGRSLALGVMVGALTAGSATPHLVAGVTALSGPMVLVGTSILACSGAALVRWGTTDGPHATDPVAFDPSAVGDLLRSPRLRAALLGYLGHMWELYAMWAAMGPFVGHVLGGVDRGSSLVTFAVLGTGAVGCVAGGRAGERVGPRRAARTALVASGVIAGSLGFLDRLSPVLVLGLAALWGAAVIADGPQLIALVERRAEPDRIGTAVTVQLALGFLLTAVPMWVVPVLAERIGWGWAFLLLAPGPLLGAHALRPDRPPSGSHHPPTNGGTHEIWRHGQAVTHRLCA